MVANTKPPRKHWEDSVILDDYDALPEPIKMSVSPREYLFMTDTQKASIIEDDCEPEY
jgi:hypothetical protein